MSKEIGGRQLVTLALLGLLKTTLLVAAAYVALIVASKGIDRLANSWEYVSDADSRHQQLIFDRLDMEYDRDGAPLQRLYRSND